MIIKLMRDIFVNIEILGAIVTMVYCILFLQKVVFLEYHTPSQMRFIHKTMLIVFGATVVVTTLFTNVLPIKHFFDPFFNCYLLFYACMIIYSSFVGRKRAKWLAFLEIVPAIGYGTGILAVISCLADLKKDYYILINVVCMSAILAAIALFSKSNLKFVRDLKRDIQNRSLTKAEECIVWVTGIWLVISDELIVEKIETRLSPGFVLYIVVLNMVVAVVIILFVITSNYRDYYTKKNLALQKSLITTMADLVENRDENTGGHIHRTSKYVEIIARKLQKDKKYSDILTDRYIEDMIIAAPLHDVGKIHIPDAILNKPGKLDADEFDTMKTHAAIGGVIIEKVERDTGDLEYLKIAKEMAEYHHERMDGKGYPHGIKGEEIPLCAKILAVADVFDALSSKRCYKEAMPLDKAFSIIEIETGDHFDVEIAKAFLDSREEIEQFINESEETEKKL